MKEWIDMNLPKAIRKKYPAKDMSEYRRRLYLGGGVIRAIGPQVALSLGLINSDGLLMDDVYKKYVEKQFPGAIVLKERIT